MDVNIHVKHSCFFPFSFLWTRQGCIKLPICTFSIHVKWNVFAKSTAIKTSCFLSPSLHLKCRWVNLKCKHELQKPRAAASPKQNLKISWKRNGFLSVATLGSTVEIANDLKHMKKTASACKYKSLHSWKVMKSKNLNLHGDSSYINSIVKRKSDAYLISANLPLFSSLAPCNFKVATHELHPDLTLGALLFSSVVSL